MTFFLNGLILQENINAEMKRKITDMYDLLSKQWDSLRNLELDDAAVAKEILQANEMTKIAQTLMELTKVSLKSSIVQKNLMNVSALPKALMDMGDR